MLDQAASLRTAGLGIFAEGRGVPSAVSSMGDPGLPPLPQPRRPRVTGRADFVTSSLVAPRRPVWQKHLLAGRSEVTHSVTFMKLNSSLSLYPEKLLPTPPTARFLPPTSITVLVW